jgi:hypothetical protein
VAAVPRRILLALALAGAGAGVSGCSEKGPAACLVTGVSVAQGIPSERMEELGLERNQLRAVGAEVLAATPGFLVPPADPPRRTPRCRAVLALMDARVIRGSGGAATAEVLISMEVTAGESEEAYREVVPGADPVGAGESSSGALLRAVRKAALRASAAVALARAEAAKPDADVLRDLDAGDPRLRDLAVRVLAERRNPAAVPPLLLRLQDPDPEVAERAVGALAQLGDPRAVGPLIELTRRREGPFVAQIVRIIGDIGGPEAEAYLETLSAGHPDPAVTRAASEGLRDLRRRQRRSPEPPTR